MPFLTIPFGFKLGYNVDVKVVNDYIILVVNQISFKFDNNLSER